MRCKINKITNQIKKLINTNKCDKSKNLIFEKIKVNCLEIIQSPFGNYAIQYIIEVIYKKIKLAMGI